MNRKLEKAFGVAVGVFICTLMGAYISLAVSEDTPKPTESRVEVHHIYIVETEMLGDAPENLLEMLEELRGDSN